MGQAKVRMLREGELLKIKYDDLQFIIARSDRALYRDSHIPEEDYNKETFRIIANIIVNSANQKGIDRKDGKTWSAWLEIMDEEGSEIDVTYGLADWLFRLAKDPELKINPGASQWREALVAYLEKIMTEKDQT